MKKSHVIIIGILTVGLSLAACKAAPEKEAANPSAEEKAPAAVTLTPEAVKTAGIVAVEAGFLPAVRTIHAPGEIIFNPKRLAHMTTRTSGRIERLFAYQGDKIREGQTLLLFYSKDFLSLQADLLQALDRFKRLEAEPAEQTIARSLLDSVRNRLRLLDVTDEELAEIEKTGIIKPLLPVRAPLTGSILESLAIAGDFVEFGVDLFRVADLSTVWADIHIFEKDMASVSPGIEAVIRIGAYPGQDFKGRLFQLGNSVEEKTRTVEGRVELANADGRLKPGMYVEAELLSSTGARILCVPAAAVQDFQNKKIVFVKTGENIFALREVETGISFDGFVEILNGLKDKEAVVAGGSFFLKSEIMKKSLGGDLP
jgi:RND family efflux transporter MFP subunit